MIPYLAILFIVLAGKTAIDLYIRKMHQIMDEPDLLCK